MDIQTSIRLQMNEKFAVQRILGGIKLMGWFQWDLSVVWWVVKVNVIDIYEIMLYSFRGSRQRWGLVLA